MTGLEAVFGTTHGITPLQECARAVVIFAYGYLVVRLIGRRVFGKWSALDIVVSIIAGSNLSRTLTGNAPMGGTLLATTLVFAVHWALANAAARSPGLSRLIEGRPVTLFQRGSPEQGALLRWSLSDADINEALRQHGLDHPSQAEQLILEPSGNVSVVRPG